MNSDGGDDQFLTDLRNVSHTATLISGHALRVIRALDDGRAEYAAVNIDKLLAHVDTLKWVVEPVRVRRDRDTLRTAAS